MSGRTTRTPPEGVRPGAQRGDVRRVPVRHDAEGPGRHQHRLRQLVLRRRTPGRNFDYLLANPPFGVEWKKVQKEVKDEHQTKGFAGRFGAGLPPHQRRQPALHPAHDLQDEACIGRRLPAGNRLQRLAAVHRRRRVRSSEIRRWIIENDWLEAIVALPDQLFYNTGIATYFWIVTNRKSPERRGKVQLVDARELWTKTARALERSASSSPMDRLPRSFVSTGTSRRATASRSSPTRHSDTSASLLNGHSKVRSTRKGDQS